MLVAVAAPVVERKRAPCPNLADSLEPHVPRIGSRPVSEVTSPDVLEILTPVRPVKVPTVRCVRRRNTAVMRAGHRHELALGQVAAPAAGSARRGHEPSL